MLPALSHDCRFIVAHMQTLAVSWKTITQRGAPHGYDFHAPFDAISARVNSTGPATGEEEIVEGRVTIKLRPYFSRITSSARNLLKRHTVNKISSGRSPVSRDDVQKSAGRPPHRWTGTRRFRTTI